MGNRFCKTRERKILIQGPRHAGKTTLLYRLKFGRVITATPSLSYAVELINVNGAEIMCWDLGFRDKSRPLYRHYYPNTQGVIFLIDSSDKERLDMPWTNL
ncbi:ADP ribosylation factor 1 [Plakobranchus ocellatus]|uniref:ADP ribosylation factor 1 n=1 Tax=Plakobranchus ocellatus TaxID=259542 RepID=A0AAV3Z547_9GAST|nr:ADP ribosylation factor 1 [Plakobranchus ocellatus]